MKIDNFKKSSQKSSLCGKYFSELLNEYRRLLLEGFLPWWLQHGIDWEYGGFTTFKNPDGTGANTNKKMWCQGRGLWTFSYLYNNFGKDNRLLEAITNTAEYLLAHGRDTDGDWVSMLTRDGKQIGDATNIFAGIFMIGGLVEYHRATDDKKALDVAIKTARRIMGHIDSPDFRGVDPSFPPGVRVHGVWMIFVSILTELIRDYPDEEFSKATHRYIKNILEHHVDSSQNLTIEVLGHDFSRLPGVMGNTVVPGHAAECVWMLKHEAERTGDVQMIDKALALLLPHMEAGWDNEYGGFFWSIDARNKQPINSNKSGWCHQEIMISLLEAIEYKGYIWAWEWYDKIHEYSFRTFPDTNHGQWHRVVTREGEFLPWSAQQNFIGNETRDDFHYPRFLMFSIQTIERLLNEGKRKE